MDFIEKFRNALDFIDDDNIGGPGSNQGFQFIGSTGQPQKVAWVQKIDDEGIFRQLLTDNSGCRWPAVEKERTIFWPIEGRVAVVAGFPYGIYIVDDQDNSQLDNGPQLLPIS